MRERKGEGRKKKKKKKKNECREVAAEIIASSYCRRYQNIFQPSEWLSRVPRATSTNTREQMTAGFP